MCTVCGCGGEGAQVEGAKGRHHHHHHDHGHDRGHDHHPAQARRHGEHHRGDHHHDRRGDLDYGAGPARAHAPGLSQARMVEIETDILAKNDGYAAQNRRRFDESATLALNLVSSPGSGKTTLLCATIQALAGRWPVAVIEGDQQTAVDADRIRATGAPAIQVNTGKGCHLDAHMVGHAVDHLGPVANGVLFIENVGNLVCPAAFDLGEDAKVAIFSVVEGEDKPLKYPDMFAAAALVILSKTDLAPHTDADMDRAEAHCRRVNPDVEILRVSSRTGEGMAAWLDWLAARRKGRIDRLAAAAEDRLAALRAAR